MNNPKTYGYSYVQDLADLLFENREALRINNIVVVWNIRYSNSEIRQLFHFSNNQRFRLDGLDLLSISEVYTYMTSDREDFKLYRKGDSLTTSHIIAIPVNHCYRPDEDSLILNGVVLLVSTLSRIRISDEQLGILFMLLNSRYPSTLSTELYQSALQKLVLHEYCGSFAPKYFRSLGESLDTISQKKDTKSLKSGLRHFSLWNVSVNDDGKPSISKEFNRNTYNERAHFDTHTSISCDTKHFLNDILRDVNPEFREGANILQILPFSEVKKTVKGTDFFLQIGLTDETGSVVVVSYRHQDEKKIACLYIYDFPYSIYVSCQLVCDYVKSLCDYITDENTHIQNQIFKELINYAFECASNRDFYERAASVLKSANEASDCLIYMINERGDFSLLSEETKKQPFNPAKHVFSSKNLPVRLQDDVDFREWLDKKLSNPKEKPYHNPESEGLVKSAMLVPVNSSKGRIQGYVVLLNRSHTPSSNSVFYNNRFISDNDLLTRICGMVFTQYQQLNNAIESRNYTLKKLRHEIPSTTGAINTQLMKIVGGLKMNPIRVNHLLTVANNISLHNSRVMLLSKFFTAVDFTPEQFAEKKINVNLFRFFNSYIDNFRTEGKYSGVDVYFEVDDEKHTIFVSNYYQLAIVNVITNAIRYAIEGSRVNIKVTGNTIEVTDIGIPIQQSEMDLIYEEGYRGRKAREVKEYGMGFGLYLTKMILEAHGSSISASCSLFGENNVLSQLAVLHYIKSLPSQAERQDYIYHGTKFPSERTQADRLYSSISSLSKDSNLLKFVTLDKDTLQFWVDYCLDNSYDFIDMEEYSFSKPIYEVVFTIKIK